MTTLRPSAIASLAVALAGGMACEAGTNPNLADVHGTWSFQERFTDPVHAMTCKDSGSYHLLQERDGFRGHYSQVGVCQVPAGRLDNSDVGDVTDGQIVGHVIRFRAPNCEYDGSLHDEDVDRLEGRVQCRLEQMGEVWQFDGFWSAVRTDTAVVAQARH